MTEKWVKKRKAENRAVSAAAKQRIADILFSPWIETWSKEDMENAGKLWQARTAYALLPPETPEWVADDVEIGLKTLLDGYKYDDGSSTEGYMASRLGEEEYRTLTENYTFDEFMEGYIRPWEAHERQRFYDNLLDSEPVEFDGDILITDPCYIGEFYKFAHEYEPVVSEFGMIRNTIIGNGDGCVTDKDTGADIGTYTVDSGLIGVYLLEDVMAFNPAFDGHIKNPWTAAVIRNFKGKVGFVVKKAGKTDERRERYSFWMRQCFRVSIVGDGINKETGERIRFVAK